MSRKREALVKRLGEAITENKNLLEQVAQVQYEIKALKAERKALNKEIIALRKKIKIRPNLVVLPD